jgi:hypothetical protein
MAVAKSNGVHVGQKRLVAAVTRAGPAFALAMPAVHYFGQAWRRLSCAAPCSCFRLLLWSAYYFLRQV